MTESVCVCVYIYIGAHLVGAIFQKDLLLLRVCVSQAGDSHTISDFFTVTIFVVVIWNQRSLRLPLQKYYDSLKAEVMISIF